MTIQNVIDAVKDMRSPSADAQRLIRWINDVEDEACKVIAQAALGDYRLQPYTEEDLDTELLIPEPYARAYVWYCAYRQDLRENQIENANNALSRYNEMMDGFKKYRTRTYLPAPERNVHMEGYHV